MPRKRKIHTANFKAKVALEALKENRTSSQLTSEFGVASGQISTWKKRLVEHSVEAFESTSEKLKPDDLEAATAPLYEQIGRLKMELEWLKKKAKQLN